LGIKQNKGSLSLYNLFKNPVPFLIPFSVGQMILQIKGHTSNKHESIDRISDPFILNSFFLRSFFSFYSF